MPKVKVSARKTVHHGNVRWRVLIPRELRRQYDGLTKRIFSDEATAIAFAREINAARSHFPDPIHDLPITAKVRVWACLEQLNGSVMELEAAVRAWCGRKSCIERKLIQVIKDCVEEKQRANRRSKYLEQFDWSLKLFAAGRENSPISRVTPEDVSAWLNGNGWGGETKRHYLGRLKTLFRFAMKRGYALSDPTETVALPSRVSKPPGILTVAECKKLLKTVLEHDKQLVPYCALCLFAGIRPEECRRLTWSDMTDGYIRIEAAKSKTRKRRLVEITAPLDKWLELKGALPPPKNFRKQWKRIRDLSGLKWTQDCLRHSFVSYSYSVHGAAKTAAIAGHSEAVLFAHYREVVTRKAADEFFKLTPEVVQAEGKPTSNPVKPVNVGVDGGSVAAAELVVVDNQLSNPPLKEVTGPE